MTSPTARKPKLSHELAEACLPAAAIASPSTVIILQPAVGAQISIVIEPPRPTLPDGS